MPKRPPSRRQSAGGERSREIWTRDVDDRGRDDRKRELKEGVGVGVGAQFTRTKVQGQGLHDEHDHLADRDEGERPR